MSAVLLIQPPIREFYLTRKRTIPYGLASIAAGLEQEGFTTEIIDALATAKSKPIDWPKKFHYLTPYYGRADSTAFSLFHRFRHFGYSHEHLACIIREKQPMAVGISSLFTAYADQALDTARAVKKFCPGTIVIMGGHHPTLFPEQTLECEAVDFVLRGEGEVSMALLCRALKNKSDQLEKIPGIGFRKEKSFHINEPAWAEELENLPLPAQNKINWNFYQRNKKAAITVVASRGCPFPCSYCSVSALSSHARFRRREVPGILNEIQIQADHRQIGFIDFEDENLTLDKKWVMELLAGIRKIFRGKQVELRAMNGLYPPSLDQEIISAMKESGFKTLNLSLGSFSMAQLKRFNRPDVRNAHDKALEMAESEGMDAVSYIIGGAPGQTANSSLEDLLMLAQRRTLAGFSVFYPAPGSRDYGICQRENILPASFALMRSTALPLDHTTSRLQAATLLRLTRILNYLKSLVDTVGGQGSSHRHRISKELVELFFTDGIIRGMDGKGKVYAHETDPGLTEKFIEHIKQCPVAGVRKGPAHPFQEHGQR